MPTWAMWIAAIGLLILRALVAATEAALYSTSEEKAKELEAIRPRSARRVLRLKQNREATTAAIRLGAVFTGYGAAGFGAFALPRTLDLSVFGDQLWLQLATPLVGALLVGVFGVVFELFSRASATSNPGEWALRLSFLGTLLVKTVYPPMRLVVSTLNLVLGPFGGKVAFEPPPQPLEDLERALAQRADNESLDRDAPQLIRSIFELSDKRCRDVMVPRTDVVCIDIATTSDEVLRLLAEESHSRLPVYRDEVDHIIGTLHTRDLIPLLQHPELIVLSDTVRPAHFVPWVKPIGDLLREMQKERIHMAVVVDEYGGFMGIVTLEDILREIVGDIGDEFSVEEQQVDKLPDGTFLVQAEQEVDEFEKAFGFSLPEGDYETLGGFLSSLSGSIPEVGERFAFNGWQFVVHSKEGARLEAIRLIRPKGLAAPANAGTAETKDRPAERAR